MIWLQLRDSSGTINFFEFEPAKSAKYGIDSFEAQGLWSDPLLLEMPAKTDDEPRDLVIGLIDGKHWSAIIAHRGANVRLISVWRAPTKEVALYES